MSDYYWDQQLEYLRNTRWLYYNDDYLEFLVQKVWKIINPVNIVDYGCGYGYLGLKLLPLLPTGSSYTGIDKGEGLITQAQEIFQRLPYPSEFRVGDLEEMSIDRQYDMAVCHAFLLHMTDPTSILRKMADSVRENGRVICFEPHWIGGMSGYHLDGVDQSSFVPLGVLQKLFELDQARGGKDGNIGLKIPAMMSQLGLKNVECRLSDKVNFLDPNMAPHEKDILFRSLREEGLGQEPGDAEDFLNALEHRGLSSAESKSQFAAELLFSKALSKDSWLAYAPGMKISFGTVRRESVQLM